jgi:hypothetical protein
MRSPAGEVAQGKENQRRWRRRQMRRLAEYGVVKETGGLQTIVPGGYLGLMV